MKFNVVRLCLICCVALEELSVELVFEWNCQYDRGDEIGKPGTLVS